MVGEHCQILLLYKVLFWDNVFFCASHLLNAPSNEMYQQQHNQHCNLVCITAFVTPNFATAHCNMAKAAEDLPVVSAGFMFTGAAVVSGAGDGDIGMLEGLIIEKLNGWDIEKRYKTHLQCWLFPGFHLLNL